MINLESQTTPLPGTPLQTLLAAIDRETAHSLAFDASYLRQRSLQQAREKKLYISFLLGENQMALPIQSIQAIGPLPTVTPLPNVPSWIKGIVQLQGEILSAVDLIKLFHLRSDRHSHQNSFLLFKHNNFKFCLIVNKIFGVIYIDESSDCLKKLLKNLDEEENEHNLLSIVHSKLITDHHEILIIDDKKIANLPLIRKLQ